MAKKISEFSQEEKVEMMENIIEAMECVIPENTGFAFFWYDLNTKHQQIQFGSNTDIDDFLVILKKFLKTQSKKPKTLHSRR